MANRSSSDPAFTIYLETVPGHPTVNPRVTFENDRVARPTVAGRMSAAIFNCHFPHVPV